MLHWYQLQIFVANNTVAIVITGPMAKQIADENGSIQGEAPVCWIFSLVYFRNHTIWCTALACRAAVRPVTTTDNAFLYYPYLLGVMVFSL